MDLKWLLVRRITLVALACLVVGSAFAVYKTSRDAMQQNVELVDLINRQLNLQLSRIKRSTDIPARFPDWDLIAGLSLQPGQCVGLRGVKAPQELRRSSCAGIDTASMHAPQWFLWAYRTLTNGDQSVARPIYFDGVALAEIVAEYDPVATAERAWATIAPLVGFAAALVSILCLVTYFVIDRALLPTREIVAALNRLARGDLTCRLPSFRLAALNRISEVFNFLTEDLRKANAERAELARRLVDAQEQERRHIARELHDEIAQKLSALNAHAACLRTRSLREAPALTGDVKELEGMASALMVSLRRTLTQLRPQEIDDLGLVQSLKDLVARHNERACGRTSYSIEMAGEIGHLRAETSAHVYRIVQEALTNASKHARARNVKVQLSRIADAGAETISLSVVDDGNGPAPDAKPASFAGSGIIGMRERVVALSGKLSAGPLPTGGFGLQVEFPTLEQGA
jgi:two-component system, NarL family, sensor histidine kinase UhpB